MMTLESYLSMAYLRYQLNPQVLQPELVQVLEQEDEDSWQNYPDKEPIKAVQEQSSR